MTRKPPVHGVTLVFSSVVDYILNETTFYRVHLTAFTLVPLVFSGIFYGCNGRFHISYLDSLFLCYSAMTVTGLSTVNLSTLTAWQQVILYVLMMMGDITTVSWVMVLVRKYYFRTKCEYVVRRTMPKRRGALFSRTPTGRIDAISPPVEVVLQGENLRLEMENMESPPQLAVTYPTPHPTMQAEPGSISAQSPDVFKDNPILTEADARTFSSSPKAASVMLPPSSPVMMLPISQENEFPRTTSFASARVNRFPPIREGTHLPYRRMTVLTHSNKAKTPLTGDVAAHADSSKYQKFGGFPGPLRFLQKAAKRTVPTMYRKLERKLTLPYTTTLRGYITEPTNEQPLSREEKIVSWLDFSGLIVGRNSDFHTESLTDEQLEKIGGAEYIALRWLSYLVPLYFVLMQLFAYILFAPWLSVTTQYNSVFEDQPRIVKKPWFSLFQVMGAYTGGGLSLVDMGMVPFQEAYLMIFALMFVILAGNHALVGISKPQTNDHAYVVLSTAWCNSACIPPADHVMLSASAYCCLILIYGCDTSWCGYKITSFPGSPGGDASDAHKAFEFLLDHPRRCFVYLFPSPQTWFLVICLVGFSVVEWVGFEVLNIGLSAFESISLGPRIVAGLFQGLAARASGFPIVPVANFAPSLQFLYMVMMYIAVYPVAMSIRATNVYEERSLGVFEAPPDDEDEEPDMRQFGPRERVGRYVGWHLRRQMSIDIWWLVWAIFIIAIIERNNLLDENKKWFDLFRILFELVSAFGGIGLSLGLPTDNFSFAGAMRPLSKLVIIVIMVRGRHRGLPVAIDRAVMLPRELELRKKAAAAQNPVAERSLERPVENTNGTELAA